jgi:hypothetical protein
MTLPLDPDRDGWFKSTRSKDGEDCVEVHLGTTVRARDTKARDAGEIELPAAAWSAFLTAVRAR